MWTGSSSFILFIIKFVYIKIVDLNINELENYLYLFDVTIYHKTLHFTILCKYDILLVDAICTSYWTLQ